MSTAEKIIIENSRLIYKFESDINHFTNFPISDGLAKKFYFEKDWNFIMRILSKINCLNFELPEDSNLIGDISAAVLNIDIEKAYISIIEFIKFYNENKN